MKPNDKQQLILTTALNLAAKQGYMHVTREQLSDKCGVAPSLVSHYFGTMVQLRRAIIGEAIRTENLDVLMQGIAAKDKRACGIHDELRRNVIIYAMGA